MLKNSTIRDEELNDYGDHLVMIIDDIKTNVLILGKILQKKNFRTIGFSDPREVLEAAIELQPDLIITDKRLPLGSLFFLLGHRQRG